MTSPYVIIRLHDVVVTTQQCEEWLKLEERKTPTVPDNGFCPQWTDSKEFSSKVESPGVAMLQFIIVHAEEGFIDNTMCRTAIPVSCLRYKGFVQCNSTTIILSEAPLHLLDCLSLSVSKLKSTFHGNNRNSLLLFVNITE